MVALQGGPMVSPYCLVTTLVCFLQICSGELTGQIYRTLLDVSHSTTATYATFPVGNSLRCLQACNLDGECKGVFYDGKLCSMVRYGTSISKAMPPAPTAMFYMKGKYIFLIQSVILEISKLPKTSLVKCYFAQSHV